MPKRLYLWVIPAVVFVVVGALVVFPVERSEDEVVSDEEAAMEFERRRAQDRMPVEVPVAVARRGDLVITSEVKGRAAPWRIAALAFEQGGRVVSRPIREGMWVQEGAELVRIADREQLLAVAEAEADVLEAQIRYRVLTRDPRRTGSNSDTSSVPASLDKPSASGAIEDSGSTRRISPMGRTDATSLLQGRSREEISAVTAGLAQAERRLERAQLALQRTRLLAPFSGRIADLDVEVGQHVSPGTPCLVLVNDGRLRVEVTVMEEAIVRVQEGAPADVRIPAADLSLRGSVVSVNPYVDQETGMGRIAISIPNPGGELMAGLYAVAEVEIERLEDEVLVPADALLSREGRTLVFRVEDGRAQWTYVDVGERNDEYLVIKEGIAPGDTVVIGNHFALGHDAVVRPIRADTPSPE